MAIRSTGELNIELKDHGFELSEVEYASIEGCLHTLREAIDCFPTKSLVITIVYHHTPEDYHIKMSLMLPGRTLFTGERDKMVHPAIERCIDKLLLKVEKFKQQMRASAELEKQTSGTHQSLQSTLDFDTKELEEARFYQDYLRFRRGLDGFQSGLSDRIGRWVQRYPELEEQIAGWVTISDIVEDVFLHAYEHFEERPADVPPGVWLESLIDPTIQDLLRYPDEEFANVCYAQHRLEHSRS
ncbi:MAG: hypothetical protein ACO1RT_16625 [Planctomycetaceae bacterium]